MTFYFYKSQIFYILCFLIIPRYTYLLQSEENFLRKLKEQNDICYKYEGLSFVYIGNYEGKEKDYFYTFNSSDIIYYNFCRNTKSKDYCPEQFISTFYRKKNGKCIKYSGSIEGEDDNVNKIQIFNFDKEDNEKYVLLNLSKGEKCSYDNSKNYSIIFNFTCERNISLSLNFSEFNNSNLCEYIIKGKCSEACGLLSSSEIRNFINTYKFYIGIVLVIIGLFCILFGAYFVHITIVIILEIIASIILLMVITYANVGFNTVMIICYIIVLIAVGVIGYFLEIKLQIFIGLIGGFCGFIFGYIVYDFFLIKYANDILFYSLLVVLIIIFGILSYKYRKVIAIIGTTIIGSYVTIKGLSFILINVIPYVDETIIKEMIDKEVNADIAATLYIYGVILAFLFILGIIFQCYLNRDKNDSDYTIEKENVEKEVNDLELSMNNMK